MSVHFVLCICREYPKGSSFPPVDVMNILFCFLIAYLLSDILTHLAINHHLCHLFVVAFKLSRSVIYSNNHLNCATFFVLVPHFDII